jgi:DNA-binding NarL/FixJ family response regulator
VRVIVADDEVLLREGLARLLAEAGFEVAGKAGDATELLRLVELRRPDLVVVDIKMPPTHTEEGLAAAREIGERDPGIGVLVLSHYLEPRYAMRLLEEHPERAGYLLKDRVSDVAVLADALRRIADGECVIDPTIVSRLVLRRLSGPLEELTEREREGLGADGRGSLERGHRRAPVPQPAHRRDPHPLDLPQAGPARDAGLPPARCGRADVPAVQLSHLHRVLMVPVALARGKGFRAGSTLGPQTLAP